MINSAVFRDGMALLASAVTVITTDGPKGLAGFTATAVCSVTDQPPTLLVCMNRKSWAYPIFVTNGVLCVNVLGAACQDVARLFADREVMMEERFARIAWRRFASGNPILHCAVVSFDCCIVENHVFGTHSVFFCQVEDMRYSTDSPSNLIYFNRTYCDVGSIFPA
ncbi:flavin reductase [Tepidiphilus sp. HLB4]